MFTLFFTLFLLSGLANFACAILIVRALNKAGFKVGFYELRWQVHKHLKTYRTLDEGTPLLYYGYIGSGLAMILFIALAFASLAPGPESPRP